MATNHTANYQLNLWEPGDSFLREEFNENTEKLEAALCQLASAGIKFHYGTYSGNGGKTKTLTAPFLPVLLVITASLSDSDFLVAVRGQTVGRKPETSSDGLLHLAWTDNSVTLTGDYNSSAACNASGVAYQYLLIG